MRLLLFFVLLVLLGCVESHSDINDVKDPFSPSTNATMDFLLRKGYYPIRENVDVAIVRKRFSDSVNLYYQFDDTKKPAELFISEIILPTDSSKLLKYLDRYDCEIISNIKKIDPVTYSFYVRNNSNHMFFSSSLTQTDSSYVLQNVYSMPYLSKSRNDRSISPEEQR